MYRSNAEVIVVREDQWNRVRSVGLLHAATYFWMGLTSGFGLAFALVGLTALMIR